MQTGEADMMTAQQFDLKLRHIEEQYAAKREGAEAYRDQEMARLFETCEWTQEKIAKRMGKKQQWVSRRLIFGRFLSSTPTGVNLNNLTERRFREYWKRTKGKESDRFAEVLHTLEHGIPHGIAAIVNQPGINKAILDFMASGKWHTTAEIIASVEQTLIGITQKQIDNGIRRIRDKPPTGHRFESKSLGTCCQYRLVKTKASHTSHPVASEVASLYEKAAPLIDELDQLGHMHEACMSPVAVRMIAAKLRRLFDAVLETATA